MTIQIKKLILLLLILKTTACMKGCIQEGHSAKNCTLCSKGYINDDFGTCSPYSTGSTASTECLISSSNSTSKCEFCSQEYYKQSYKCHSLSSPQTIPNCFSHTKPSSYSSKETADTILCSHCSGSFPSENRASCQPWSEYTGSSNLANCEVSVRESSKHPFCYRCNQGFVYDLINKKCVSSSLQGCWQFKNGKCQNCQAWNGWFTDGIDASTGGVRCSKEEDLQNSPIAFHETNYSAKKNRLSNKSDNAFSEKFMKEVKDDFNYFREFKQGFIFKDDDRKVKWYSNSTGEVKKADFGRESMPLIYFKIGNYSYTSFYTQNINCFYFSSFCVTIHRPLNKTKKVRGKQRLFVFKGTNPLFNGDIYINEQSGDDKEIVMTAPITKSSYLIMAFKTGEDFRGSDTPMLLRIDYLNTERQFGYEVPENPRELEPYYLYYIEYSNYFLAGYDGGNGILAYDLTQTSKLPAIRVGAEDFGTDVKAAYLEGSRVILANPKKTTRIYGYSFFGGKTLYHITALGEPDQIVPIKASDFYVVGFFENTESTMHFYRLGTLVLATVEKRKSLKFWIFSNMQFSEYYGNLLASRANLLLKFSPTEEALNPSCQSVGASKFAFTNYGCSACSSKAKVTEKGVCELAWDTTNLPYLNKNISVDLPVNINGQKFELKQREEYLGFWNWIDRHIIWFIILGGILVVLIVGLMIFGIVVLCNECIKRRKRRVEAMKSRQRQQQISPVTNRINSSSNPWGTFFSGGGGSVLK